MAPSESGHRGVGTLPKAVLTVSEGAYGVKKWRVCGPRLGIRTKFVSPDQISASAEKILKKVAAVRLRRPPGDVESRKLAKFRNG